MFFGPTNQDGNPVGEVCHFGGAWPLSTFKADVSRAEAQWQASIGRMRKADDCRVAVGISPPAIPSSTNLLVHRGALHRTASGVTRGEGGSFKIFHSQASLGVFHQGWWDTV